MSRRSKAAVPWLFALLFSTSALADEVIYFTNGTSLPIRSHRIESEMISVDLGADARMGFPLYMVDKIESAGRQVFLNPTYHPSNQAVAGAPGSTPSGEGEIAAIPARDYSVTGEGSVPSRYRRSGMRSGIAGDPNHYVGAGGPAETSNAPAAGRANSAMGRLRPVGNRALLPSSSSGGNAAQAPTQALNPSRGRSGLARFSGRVDAPPPSPPETDAFDVPGSEVPPSEGSTESPPADDLPPAD